MFKAGFIKRAASLLLAAITVLSFPVAAAASTSSTSPYTGKTYTHATAFDGYNRYDGVDVSSHNGTVSWSKVKADGIDFAVIRAGFTGYTKKRHSINTDPLASSNISGASSAGLSVGVYWYSQALTQAEARAEANKVLEILNGAKLDLPVFFDYEFAGVSDGRLDSAWSEGTITKSQMTANARAFCQVIEAAGYEAGIYASKSFLTTQLDGAGLAKSYKVWLAHYTTKTDYTGGYYMWQYSSSGDVNGISGNVDCNFMYLPKGSEISKVYEVIGFNVNSREDNGTDLTLSWNAVSGAVKYEIYTVNGSSETLKGTSTSNKFTFTDLTPATKYSFRVKAYNASRLIAKNNAYSAYTAPAGVSGLQASVSNGAAKISWNTMTCSGYSLEWATDPAFSANKGSVDLTGSASNSYTLNLDNYATYYFRIRAWQNSGTTKIYGNYSGSLSVTYAPPEPDGFSLSAYTDTSAAVDWNDIDGVQGYRVYTVSGDSQTLAGTTADSNFTLTDLAPATEYKIRVEAYAGSLSSSAEYAVCTAPREVEGFSARITENGAAQLSWNAVSCSGYIVEWATDSDFTQNTGSAKLDASATSYTMDFEGADEYFVRIRAYKDYSAGTVYGNDSAYVDLSVLPFAPSGFRVYGRGDGGTDLYLSWNAAKGADVYRVYILNGEEQEYKGSTAESRFTFTDLDPAAEYSVLVIAENGYGTASAQTAVCTAPAAVTGLTAAAGGNTITANWNGTDCDGYVIQWSTSPSFSRIAGSATVNGADVTEKTFSAQNAGKYYVRIRAWKNDNGVRIYGDFSAPAKVN